jgi:hypothetical protein
MYLYLGNSERLKIVTSSGACQLVIQEFADFTNGIKLKSFDNYILKDSNDVYLTVKEDE